VQAWRAVAALDHERLISVRRGCGDDVRQRLAVGGAEAADVATDGEERRPAADIGIGASGLLLEGVEGRLQGLKGLEEGDKLRDREGAGGLAFVLSSRGLLG
jgi:hypothetical protein